MCVNSCQSRNLLNTVRRAGAEFEWFRFRVKNLGYLEKLLSDRDFSERVSWMGKFSSIY